MYTKFFFQFFSSFLAFFSFGLLLSNAILLYIGLVPLFFSVLGVVLSSPNQVKLSRDQPKMDTFTGDVIEVNVEVRINDGVGMVFVGDKLPSHFELIEGNNFKVFWKGFLPKKEFLHYKVRCTKRGIYNFECLTWESNHFLKFVLPVCGKSDEKMTLVVRPRTMDIRKIRNLKSITNLPMPLGAMHRTGISTTDFQEIRNYTFGDTFKSINWKATAKISHRIGWVPQVNEYEKEGKKIVWIFVDGSKAMGQLGTTISNPFEFALLAANDLSNYYLERNCLVGLYLFGKYNKLIFPDLGRSQKYKISRELLDMKMGDEEPLREAVKKIRKYMAGSNPLFIVLTTLAERKSSDELEHLVEGVKEIAKYSKRQLRHAPPIILVNILGYYFVADSYEKRLAADILKVEEAATKQKLRKSGVVVDWDPTKEKLMKILLKEVRSR